MHNTLNLTPGILLKNGEYRVEKVLGQGGFGITYLGVQTSLGRNVAIKEFFIEDYCNRNNKGSVSVTSSSKKKNFDDYLKKFIKEAKHIASLEHKHIVSLIDIFEENGTAYYVMKYYGNGSLKDKVDRCGSLSEQAALRYIRQLASALDYVHSKRIMHLDVKPGNILLDDDDNVILIDFGLSKHYDAGGHQTTGTPVGISAGYTPKEQYMSGGVGVFSPATDIYSLGATLYRLVVGECPPDAIYIDVNKGLPTFPNNVSPIVRKAIVSSMRPNKEDRPQSIEEFLALLESKDERGKSKDERAKIKEQSEEQNKELIDDVDVEVTVLPERGKSKDERGKIKEQSAGFYRSQNAKAIKEDNEETRAVEKKTEEPTVENNEPVAPKKNRAALVAAVVLLGVLVGGGLFFGFIGGDSNNGGSNIGNDRLASHSAEPAPPVVNTDSIVAARMQAYQDSIAAVNSAREAEEARLAAQQAAAEEAARREREEQARREREEAERLAREQQQGISTQKKVDLGLSVCWAGWNVGASSPEGYGNYYAWGETTTKTNYTESSYQYHNGSDYVNIGSNISGTQYDVARAQWGGSWRMPTKAEFQDLIDRCTWTWTTYKGINGYKVTGPNGNSIFLPAAGRCENTGFGRRGSNGSYFSGRLHESHSYNTYYLSFTIGGFHVLRGCREYGCTVRPVCDK